MALKKSTESNTINSVRESIGELLPASQVSIACTARVMGTSVRTLQRRLAEQGLCFSRLVDEVRFVKARELMLHQDKLMDVATQLGYTDAGSFTRAFERWTGMTPMQYRKRFYRSTDK